MVKELNKDIINRMGHQPFISETDLVQKNLASGLVVHCQKVLDLGRLFDREMRLSVGQLPVKSALVNANGFCHAPGSVPRRCHYLNQPLSLHTFSPFSRFRKFMVALYSRFRELSTLVFAFSQVFSCVFANGVV